MPARRILRRTTTRIVFKNWSSQILEQFNRGICFRGHSNSHQGTASRYPSERLGQVDVRFGPVADIASCAARVCS